MLVQPGKRAGQMPFVEVVWFKGHRTLALGVQIHLRKGSVCIELAQEGKTKEAQLESNHCFVASSHGQLAPVQGSERFLALASSHSRLASCCGSWLSAGLILVM